jgi:Domain of unknown function
VDHLDDELNMPIYDNEKEVQKAESVTRSLGIISVLIAAVTFAAIFTMPGGYFDDDHVNRGTPILGRKYTFKAFIVADLLAFVLSIFATTWLMYAGFSITDFKLRLVCLIISTEMVKIAAKSTVCAFALAAYTVLSPINLPISILFCVATFGLLPFSNPSGWEFLSLAYPLAKRLGCRGLFKSDITLQTQKRITVSVWFNYSLGVLFGITKNLILYTVIFLLALL